ncbi:hypothetical protein FRC06_011323, partial [Ceratobasidium sp. 370]
MRPAISKPQPSLMPSSSSSCSGRVSPVSMRSIKSTSSTNSTSPLVVRGCGGGPSSVAGPGGCRGPCATAAQRTRASPQRPPRPEQAEASSAGVYEERVAEEERAPPPPPPVPSSPQTKLKLARVSTVTHLSIASSPFVLPFTSRRRPSIPLEDFPASPTDDEWEDFSFEEDIVPISPTSPPRRNTLRRKPSVPHSPRLIRGTSLARSHASRRSRRSRPNAMSSRTPTSQTPKSSRFPSVYSTYSFYDPAQLDAPLDDQSDILEQVADSADPIASLLSLPAEREAEAGEFGQVPGGANLDPRGSVSSVSTVRPSVGQRSQSRLGGLRDRFRWLPGRSGSGQDSSSDESAHVRASSDTSSIDTFDSVCPLYARAKTTTGRTVVFSKPGFRSLRGPGAKPGSPDFQPEHEYKSSTDSSSYAPSFSSFERNLRVGGTAGSQSSCDDSFAEGSPRSKPRPLSPFAVAQAEEPKNITGPPVPCHVRSRSHNFQYPRPRTVRSFESLRQPRLRDKNDVPHHPFQPLAVPYPLAYSPAMMAADRWNHALLFGDERNPASAGGLLRGSTVSFSQFYGVGSGRKEVLKGKELRGGKVLDIGCGEGLWVLTAAKEWKYTRFVGFDLMPVQMNLEERLQGVKNASDIIDRIEWINGDCLNAPLPFDDNSFDLIRLANMTMALPTDAEADNWRLRALFSEIFRVLKVDGELEVIDENHTVPSASAASPGNPGNAAFSATGSQCHQLEQAFANMLTYHRLSAYPVIPELLKQHFSTASEKAHFRLAVAPDSNVVERLARRDGLSDETATRVEIDRDLGLANDVRTENLPSHGRARSGSVAQGRNRKMLQLLGKEFVESRKSAPPAGLIVLPNKMLPMSPAAVYAHATHSTNVILAAKEQLFDFVELCARGRAVADRQEFEDLLWEYESTRFDRLGLRDPLQTFDDWDSGMSDANEGLWSSELRSPKYASCTSPPPLDTQP